MRKCCGPNLVLELSMSLVLTRAKWEFNKFFVNVDTSWSQNSQKFDVQLMGRKIIYLHDWGKGHCV